MLIHSVWSCRWWFWGGLVVCRGPAGPNLENPKNGQHGYCPSQQKNPVYEFFYPVKRNPCQEGHLAMEREVFETVVSPHPAVLDPAW